MEVVPRARGAGVRKPPREETAGASVARMSAAISGTSFISIPHIAALMRATRYGGSGTLRYVW